LLEGPRNEILVAELTKSNQIVQVIEDGIVCLASTILTLNVGIEQIFCQGIE